MGHMGFFVRHEGVLRKAFWVSRPQCDYQATESEEASGVSDETEVDIGEFEAED